MAKNGKNQKKAMKKAFFLLFQFGKM